MSRRERVALWIIRGGLWGITLGLSALLAVPVYTRMGAELLEYAGWVVIGTGIGHGTIVGLFTGCVARRRPRSTERR